MTWGPVSIFPSRRETRRGALVPTFDNRHNQAHVGNCTQLVEHAGTRVDDCAFNLGMTYLNGRKGKTVEQSTNYINANGVGPERDGSQLMTISEVWGDQG
jgi:hypothetical protein